jgi:multidrug efflux pump subunit AcrB
MLLPAEVPEEEREREEESAPRRGFFAAADLVRRHAFEMLRDVYEVVLHAAMARRKVTLAVGALLVVASAFLLGTVGLDFFPTVDAGLMRLHYRAPPGTRIEETERLVDAVEQRVRRIVPSDEIATIDDNIGVPTSYNIGFVPTANASGQDAEVTIGLKPKHHAVVDYQDRIREEVRREFPGSTMYFEQADIVSQVLNFGLPAPIDVEVQARQYQQAVPFALRLQHDMETIPGVRDVRLGQVLNHPSFMVNVDRARAADLGVAERDVASSLLTSLSSSFLASPSFWVDPATGVNYTVAVQTPYFHIDGVPALMSTPVTGPSSSTSAPGAAEMQAYAPPTQLPAPAVSPIAPYLGNVATLERIVTRTSIHHETVQPTLDVQCGVQGRDLGAVARDIDAAVKRLGVLRPASTSASPGSRRPCSPRSSGWGSG